MKGFSVAVMYLSAMVVSVAGFAPGIKSKTFNCPYNDINTCNSESLLSSITTAKFTSKLQMAGGEGGDTEWAKALMDSVGTEPGTFDKELQAQVKGKGRGKMEERGTMSSEERM